MCNCIKPLFFFSFSEVQSDPRHRRGNQQTGARLIKSQKAPLTCVYWITSSYWDKKLSSKCSVSWIFKHFLLAKKWFFLLFCKLQLEPRNTWNLTYQKTLFCSNESYLMTATKLRMQWKYTQTLGAWIEQCLKKAPDFPTKI